ncbi:hypothetical protein [Salinigranum halophilum]|uniref:hypothetical protein n=1 Tax=Salinigranum halophilum TaxID=2565931 RepID=UPI0010A84CD9|nr:hypothetical protein [Salinigranum halophilum]
MTDEMELVSENDAEHPVPYPVVALGDPPEDVRELVDKSAFGTCDTEHGFTVYVSQQNKADAEALLERIIATFEDHVTEAGVLWGPSPEPVTFPKAARQLYGYMVEDGGEVWAGSKEVRDELGYTKRSLARAATKLEELGFIRVERLGDWNRRYHVVPDGMPEELPGPTLDEEWHSEEWLRRRYVDEGRPMKELAEEAGVSQPTINYHLKKQGIETTPRFTSGGVVSCCPLGVRFRSEWEHEVAHRLEDEGVDWEHEPVRLQTDAGDYVPDFVCGSTLVEVKGRVYEDCGQAESMRGAMRDGWRVVVVGADEARDELPHDEFVEYAGGDCAGLAEAVRR